MIYEERLSEVIPKDVSLRLIEPHIYSLYPPNESAKLYDRFGGIYEAVACNGIYNRLIWGYRISEYHHFCLNALRSSTGGWVLDAGCGSLAFTAKAYLDYSGRPVVLLDSSIRMLRLAKERLLRLNRKIPENMIFLHGDALRLPFKPHIFGTIVSFNLLHAVEDVKTLLSGFKNLLTERGSMYFTTLVENGRFADKYLHKLGKGGYLYPRSPERLFPVFDETGIPAKYRIEGNLAFIETYRRTEWENL